MHDRGVSHTGKHRMQYVVPSDEVDCLEHNQKVQLIFYILIATTAKRLAIEANVTYPTCVLTIELRA